MQNNNTKQNILSEQIKDAKDTLARIIGFIGNCDTKAGMVLAISGVLSIILANSGILKLIKLMIDTALINSSCLTYVFVITLFICGASFLYGVFRLTCAILANVTSYNKNSRTFFGDIANSELSSYKQAFQKHTEEQILDDLLNQIYINAKICTNKFKNYNQGVKLIRNSVTFFIFIVFFGFILTSLQNEL